MNSHAYIEYKLKKFISLSVEHLIEPTHLDPRLTQSYPIAPDKRFPEAYLKKHHATREGGSHGMRGDSRSPEELNYTIQPQCSYPHTKPDFDLTSHRAITSECSGFASLTTDAGQARKFGTMYLNWLDSFYLYTTQVNDGFRVDDAFTEFPKEKEISSIEPTPIDSFRKCKRVPSTTHFKCGNIFVRSDLDKSIQEKLVSEQLTPYEKRKGITAGK